MTSKGTRFPHQSYTRQECLDLIEACGETWCGRRNQALLVLLWRSGLRLNEALSLFPHDLDFDSLSVRVLHAKASPRAGARDKARTVGMDRHEAKFLEEWLSIRGDLPAGSPMICTRQGTKLKQPYVRALLPRLARKAGISKRIHAHGFRHTFAVELSRANVPVHDISQLLGHSNLKTTTIYLESLSPEEALDHVRKRVW